MMRAGFYGPYPVAIADKRDWRDMVQLPDLLVFVSRNGNSYYFPAGFQSDKATADRLTRRILPIARRAYPGHDALRETPGISSGRAAKVLREMLEHDGVGFGWRWAIYLHQVIKGWLRKPVRWGQPNLTPIDPTGAAPGYVELQRKKLERPTR